VSPISFLLSLSFKVAPASYTSFSTFTSSDITPLQPLCWPWSPSLTPHLGLQSGGSDILHLRDKSSSLIQPRDLVKGQSYTRDPALEHSLTPRLVDPIPSHSYHPKSVISPRMCRCGRPSIPQRIYQPNHRSFTDRSGDIILFSMRNGCGIPLLSALRGQFSGLRRRNSGTFDNMDCGVSISLRIEVISCFIQYVFLKSLIVASGRVTIPGQLRRVLLHYVSHPTHMISPDEDT
jgi:hypothetical protein